MRAFQPSPAFVSFFNAVIADAEAPVTAGTYAPVIPDFADPFEQAFAHTKLLALIQQIEAMRRSLAPTTTAPLTIGQLAAAAESGDAAAQAAYEQLLWQQASSSAP